MMYIPQFIETIHYKFLLNIKKTMAELTLYMQIHEENEKKKFWKNTILRLFDFFSLSLDEHTMFILWYQNNFFSFLCF